MITATQAKLSEVLGDTYIHEIPPYQRPYAWTTIEAEELLDDILEAANDAGKETYFLGSIVLIKPKDSKLGQVVDGQQRLTTLTILAAVLRDLADDQQEREALGDAVYIQPNPYKNQAEAERLRPHNLDKTFFKETIQKPASTSQAKPAQAPATDAQNKMWENVLILRDRIRAMSASERKKLVTYMLNDCVLVVVATESRNAALRIFRVLNDRGMDLSNADVIKADLLDKFQDVAQQTHYADLWRQWENELTREGFEKLLEILRFIKERDKNRRGLSQAFSERFAKSAVFDVKDFFQNELAPAKNAYVKIIDCDVDDFPPQVQARVKHALQGLALIPNKDWLPTAIASFLKMGTTEKLVVTLEGLEGIGWAMQLARRYDTQRSKRYVQVLKAVDADDALLNSSLALTNEESQEAYRALNGPLYQIFPTSVVRAILERLDYLLAEQSVVWEGTKTVEHILPQSPETKDWKGFNDSQKKQCTHCLGNLVLLTRRKNSSASNQPFSEKKKTYFGLNSQNKKTATYASVLELAHYPIWDHAAYVTRHKKHVDLLSSRWGITFNQ